MRTWKETYKNLRETRKACERTRKEIKKATLLLEGEELNETDAYLASICLLSASMEAFGVYRKALDLTNKLTKNLQEARDKKQESGKTETKIGEYV